MNFMRLIQNKIEKFAVVQYEKEAGPAGSAGPFKQEPPKAKPVKSVEPLTIDTLIPIIAKYIQTKHKSVKNLMVELGKDPSKETAYVEAIATRILQKGYTNSPADLPKIQADIDAVIGKDTKAAPEVKATGYYYANVKNVQFTPGNPNVLNLATWNGVPVLDFLKKHIVDSVVAAITGKLPEDKIKQINDLLTKPDFWNSLFQDLLKEGGSTYLNEKPKWDALITKISTDIGKLKVSLLDDNETSYYQKKIWEHISVPLGIKLRLADTGDAPLTNNEIRHAISLHGNAKTEEMLKATGNYSNFNGTYASLNDAGRAAFIEFVSGVQAGAKKGFKEFLLKKFPDSAEEANRLFVLDFIDALAKFVDVVYNTERSYKIVSVGQDGKSAGEPMNSNPQAIISLIKRLMSRGFPVNSRIKAHSGTTERIGQDFISAMQAASYYGIICYGVSATGNTGEVLLNAYSKADQAMGNYINKFFVDPAEPGLKDFINDLGGSFGLDSWGIKLLNSMPLFRGKNGSEGDGNGTHKEKDPAGNVSIFEQIVKLIRSLFGKIPGINKKEEAKPENIEKKESNTPMENEKNAAFNGLIKKNMLKLAAPKGLGIKTVVDNSVRKVLNTINDVLSKDKSLEQKSFVFSPTVSMGAVAEGQPMRPQDVSLYGDRSKEQGLEVGPVGTSKVDINLPYFSDVVKDRQFEANYYVFPFILSVYNKDNTSEGINRLYAKLKSLEGELNSSKLGSKSVIFYIGEMQTIPTANVKKPKNILEKQLNYIVTDRLSPDKLTDETKQALKEQSKSYVANVENNQYNLDDESVKGISVIPIGLFVIESAANAWKLEGKKSAAPEENPESAGGETKVAVNDNRLFLQNVMPKFSMLAESIAPEDMGETPDYQESILSFIDDTLKFLFNKNNIKYLNTIGSLPVGNKADEFIAQALISPEEVLTVSTSTDFADFVERIVNPQIDANAKNILDQVVSLNEKEVSNVVGNFIKFKAEGYKPEAEDKKIDVKEIKKQYYSALKVYIDRQKPELLLEIKNIIDLKGNYSSLATKIAERLNTFAENFKVHMDALNAANKIQGADTAAINTNFEGYFKKVWAEISNYTATLTTKTPEYVKLKKQYDTMSIQYKDLKTKQKTNREVNLGPQIHDLFKKIQETSQKIQGMDMISGDKAPKIYKDISTIIDKSLTVEQIMKFMQPKKANIIFNIVKQAFTKKAEMEPLTKKIFTDLMKDTATYSNYVKDFIAASTGAGLAAQLKEMGANAIDMSIENTLLPKLKGIDLTNVDAVLKEKLTPWTKEAMEAIKQDKGLMKRIQDLAKEITRDYLTSLIKQDIQIKGTQKVPPSIVKDMAKNYFPLTKDGKMDMEAVASVFSPELIYAQLNFSGNETEPAIKFMTEYKEYLTTSRNYDEKKFTEWEDKIKAFKASAGGNKDVAAQFERIENLLKFQRTVPSAKTSKSKVPTYIYSLKLINDNIATAINNYVQRNPGEQVISYNKHLETTIISFKNIIDTFNKLQAYGSLLSQHMEKRDKKDYGAIKDMLSTINLSYSDIVGAIALANQNKNTQETENAGDMQVLRTYSNYIIVDKLILHAKDVSNKVNMIIDAYKYAAAKQKGAKTSEGTAIITPELTTLVSSLVDVSEVFNKQITILQGFTSDVSSKELGKEDASALMNRFFKAHALLGKTINTLAAIGDNPLANKRSDYKNMYTDAIGAVKKLLGSSAYTQELLGGNFIDVVAKRAEETK